MSILVLTINYKTAPIALREQVAFTIEQLEWVLPNLYQLPSIMGCVVLSTCNRSEFYLSVTDFEQAKEELIEWLCDLRQLTLEAITPACQWYQQTEAIQHLMRVSSGIDSRILGEAQILGQVKNAYRIAQRLALLSSELARLFQKSFTVAKKIRHETHIGDNAISLAFAACYVARRLFPQHSPLTILLLGAGKTIKLVSKYLQHHTHFSVIIANRTLAHAQQIAHNHKTKAISLDELNDHLPLADIVISATSSEKVIITYEQIIECMAKRQQQPMLFIDMAVPRDVQSEVANLANITLYAIDDLLAITQQNLGQRQQAALQAQQIIEEQSLHFMAWLYERNSVSTIQNYREQCEQIRTELVNKAINALQQGKDSQIIINELAYKLTNRLIHAPTKALQQAAQSGEEDKLQLLRSSLGLDNH